MSHVCNTAALLYSDACKNTSDTGMCTSGMDLHYALFASKCINTTNWFKNCQFLAYKPTLIIVYFRYVRAEVLAGFVNGLFLLFIAFFIMSEAVEVCGYFLNT